MIGICTGAALHTEILKETELHHFYQLYPEKFNNKTNGITFRRWLLHCNPLLADQITEWIGDGYKKDAAELKKLEKFASDEQSLQNLLQIKKENKHQLSEYLKRTQGIELNEDSVFDIQIKRLHEYKRQQMNALYVIYKYLEIKSGKLPKTPITVIFGAKAAPAYVIAKDIIHLILCLQELINQDPEVSPYLNVVMVENYNVTLAEKLIPACDISEQISLASKEASGTGNMKFMLNGAVTLGTEDGANVEIHQFVGDDNIYIFGAKSDEVIAHYEKSDYRPSDYYTKNSMIQKAVEFITGPQMIIQSNTGSVIPKCCNRIQETGCQPAKSSVSKRWLCLYFLDFTDIFSICSKHFADILIYSEIDHIIRQKFSDQKLCRYIIYFLFPCIRFLLFCHILHNSHQCLVNLLITAF